MERPVLEIRFHGRGGQGGVTCAKIVAAVYASLGKSVQTFGDYAGERSGAPVRAYTRVADDEVTNRNKVYDPDHLLVLDPTLLGDDVVAGLAPGGTLLVNTPEPLQRFAGRFPQFRLAVVDATGIARTHRIGTRSVVIVNTTMAGAFVRALDLPLDALDDAYRHLGLASNMGAARDAFEAVQVREPAIAAPARERTAPATTLAPVLPLTEQVESQPTGLRTGSWRTQRPVYAEHVAPCNAFCPAGNDVVGFVQALLQGEEAAAAVLAKTTPLPGVCGRVCPAPCMEGCNRREHDGAVNIRGLERWIADHSPAPQPVAKRADAKRFAVIGGGPAGLAAAWTLAREGQHVTIFDGELDLGGVLRTGIPQYRLPREVLDREVDGVLALGVETSLGDFLGPASLADIAGSFDATIVATGLQRPRGMDGVGEGLEGVEQGISFLHRLNAGAELPERMGDVVVLGGGNTAMDCARSALRARASKVTVVYRRGRGEMPAIAEEVEQAVHEGVELAFVRQPVGFTSLAGRVRGVVVAEVELGAPDETGRRRPVVTERRETIPADHVLLALGQSADLSLLPRGWELEAGRILPGSHDRPIVAAGDVSTAEGTVTHAIGDGRRAAGRAMRAVGLDVAVFERPDRALAVPVTDIRIDHFAAAPAAAERLLPAGVRARSLAEVSAGLPDALEAHRCFSCGHCTQCDTCLVYCPEGIIRRRAPSGEERYEVDYSFCKGCGICVTECPRKAMEMSS